MDNVDVPEADLGILDRQSETLLALAKLPGGVTYLILASPSLERGADRSEHRFGVQGPFEQNDVAELREPLGRGNRAGRARPICKHDEGDVRPDPPCRAAG
jgi:hypothetical protein